MTREEMQPNVCLMCHKDAEIHLERGKGVGPWDWAYEGESFCSMRCLAAWLGDYKRIPDLEEELKRIRRLE